MRDDRIDTLRCFCNVLVIATHAYPFMYVANHGVEFWFCTFLARHFGLVLLPTLFFISGYCMFLKQESFAVKILGRVRRLLIPYFVWNIIFLMLYMLLGMFSNEVHNNLVEWGCVSFGGCLRRLLAINERVIDGPMWYVRCLFVMCLFYPALKWIYHHTSWMLSFGVGVLLVVLGDNYCSQYYPSYAIAAFINGGYIAHHRIDVFAYIGKHRAIFWPVAVGGLMGGFVWNILHGSIAGSASICKLMSIPLFILLVKFISGIMNNDFVKKYVVPSSFTIYASHFFFTTIYIHLMGPFITKIVCGMMVITLAIIILSLLSSIVVWRVANVIAPRMFQVIDGRWLSLRGKKC